MRTGGSAILAKKPPITCITQFSLLKAVHHRCLATLLAATYLVVGASGDGLYYLLESPAAEQAESSVSYVHEHGDGLWHHHGVHSHAGGETVSTDTSVDTPEQPSYADATTHHDHTTLLLAIASALKLSLLAELPHAEIPSGDAIISVCEYARAWASKSANLGPRGPPGLA